MDLSKVPFSLFKEIKLMNEEEIIHIPDPLFPVEPADHPEEDISYYNFELDSESEFCQNTTTWD